MFRKSLLSSAVLAATLGLAACGGGGVSSSAPAPSPSPAPTPAPAPAPTPAPAPAPTPAPAPATVSVGDTIALTANSTLLSFNREAPATIIGSIAVSGMVAGDFLVGIDIRPANNTLYALGGKGNLYTVVPSTGVATRVSTLAADPTDTTAPFTALSGASFSLDFNPVADRLRVISNTGQDLRINVDTGATTTDGTITPTTAVVSGSAYTNSFAGTTSTRLLNINLTTSTLDVQNPPNDGTQMTGTALGVTPTAADFDIDATNNIGYASMVVGGVSQFYRINTQVGAAAPAATLIGAIGGGERILGIALQQTQATVVTGLTSTNGLISFSPRTPNTISATLPITGLNAGEVVLGMDVRPQDGLLWAVANSGRIYTLNTTTGAATFRTMITGATLDASPTASVDFNPGANRLRVVTANGQSLRIAVVDIPAAGTTAAVPAGTTVVDGAINRTGGAASTVLAAAYSNNFPALAGFTPATVLFDLDGTTDVLAQQNPPNNGTLVDVGPLGVDINTLAGFDIAGGENGLVLGAVRAGNTGPFLLRSINLATGAVAPYNFTSTGTATTDALSQIGGANGPVLRDIAISLPK